MVSARKEPFLRRHYMPICCCISQILWASSGQRCWSTSPGRKIKPSTSSQIYRHSLRTEPANVPLYQTPNNVHQCLSHCLQFDGPLRKYLDQVGGQFRYHLPLWPLSDQKSVMAITNYKLHRQLEKILPILTASNGQNELCALHFFFLPGAVHYPTTMWHRPWLHTTMVEIRMLSHLSFVEVRVPKIEICQGMRGGVREVAATGEDWIMLDASLLAAAIVLIHGKPLLTPLLHRTRCRSLPALRKNRVTSACEIKQASSCFSRAELNYPALALWAKLFSI